MTSKRLRTGVKDASEMRSISDLADQSFPGTALARVDKQVKWMERNGEERNIEKVINW